MLYLGIGIFAMPGWFNASVMMRNPKQKKKKKKKRQIQDKEAKMASFHAVSPLRLPTTPPAEHPEQDLVGLGASLIILCRSMIFLRQVNGPEVLRVALNFPLSQLNLSSRLDNDGSLGITQDALQSTYLQYHIVGLAGDVCFLVRSEIELWKGMAFQISITSGGDCWWHALKHILS
ncbi:hypothetical protein OG21DRAFT_1528024 [Imleria badia]|nr:hypothetical protein OG21DRAFT_1528024 [Imleria badia]